jgi:hypothetical protein
MNRPASANRSSTGSERGTPFASAYRARP